MKKLFFITIIFLLCCMVCVAQDFTLTGRVTDEHDNPVELASVTCLAQGKATMTNLRGEFSMQR